jgi:hypothetical protein
MELLYLFYIHLWVASFNITSFCIIGYTILSDTGITPLMVANWVCEHKVRRLGLVAQLAFPSDNGSSSHGLCLQTWTLLTDVRYTSKYYDTCRKWIQYVITQSTFTCTNGAILWNCRDLGSTNSTNIVTTSILEDLVLILAENL